MPLQKNERPKAVDERLLTVLKVVAKGWQDYDDVEQTFAFKCHFCDHRMGDHAKGCVVELSQQILAELGIFQEP